MSVGFWKPIERSDSFWGTAADFYFNYGGEKFTSLNERLTHPDLNENLQKLAVLEKRESVTTGVNTALKMFSMITVVIPVAMLLIKLISRYQMDDYLVKKKVTVDTGEETRWYKSNVLMHFKNSKQTCSRQYVRNENGKITKVLTTRNFEGGKETLKTTIRYTGVIYSETAENNKSKSIINYTDIFNQKNGNQEIIFDDETRGKEVITILPEQTPGDGERIDSVLTLRNGGKILKRECFSVMEASNDYRYPKCEKVVELVYDANNNLTKKTVRRFGQEVLKEEGEFDEKCQLKSGGKVTETERANGVETESVYTLSDDRKTSGMAWVEKE